MPYEYPDFRSELLRWFGTVNPLIRKFFADLRAGTPRDQLEPQFNYEIMASMTKAEWMSVGMAIDTYADLKDQVNNGTVSSLGHDRNDANRIGLTFVDAAYKVFSSPGGSLPLHIDETWFDGVYSEIERYFAEPTVPGMISFPIHGLTCESGGVALDENTAFVRLGDEQLRDYQKRHIHFVEADVSGVFSEDLRYTIQHRFTVPKDPATPVDAHQKLLGKLESVRIAAQRALSMSIRNACQSSGMFLERTGWMGGTISLAATTPIIFRKGDSVHSNLCRADEEGTRTAWQRFSDPNFVSSNTDLTLAADRIWKANTETQPADRLVDVMIAIEALYSRDTSANVELPYRLSLRAARFIAEEVGLTQRQTFQLVRQGFAARGRILRNLPVRASDRNDANDLDAFTSQIERLARLTLRKMAFAERPNWKALTLA